MSASTATPAHETGGPAALPRHVAVIMDGNGRWAKRRHLPRVAGHRQGVEALRETIRTAGELGIEALTLYAFSSENWRRPAAEITDLMGLLRFYIRRELAELDRNGVRLMLIGDWRALESDIVTDLEAACVRTAGNRGLKLVMALNYGAHAELLRVIRQCAHDAAEGRLDPATITTQTIDDRLDTAGLPPLDLMIRTSGETRLSNFLLWQAAYAELLFVETLWPDFDRRAFEAALAEFARRERRYGGR